MVGSFARAVTCAVVAAVLVVVAGAPSASAWPRPPRVDRTPPTAPTDLRATAVTQTSVTLAWTRSTDNVGVVSYSVWGDGTGLSSALRVNHPTTTATVSGLRPGQTITFQVKAFDARLNGSPAATVTVTTVADTTGPSAPSGLSVQAVDGSKVLLRWTSATDALGPVTHQVLVNGAVTPHAWSTVPAGTFPRPSVQGAWVRQLEPGTTYQFAVRAMDGSGNVSGRSNTVTATTAPSSDTVAPTAPRLVTAFAAGTSICPEELWLRWEGSSDDVDAATAIEYEVRVDGVINDVYAHGTTQAVVYTEATTRSVVTLVAVDRAGNASAPSNGVDVDIRIGIPCGT
jgi:hypothetical protein